MSEEPKIDKRTREYKESMKEEPTDLLGAPIDTETVPFGPIVDPVLARLDEKLDEILAGVRALLLKEVMTPTEPVAKEKEPAPVGDLTKCMKCGIDLPETETPRRVQELCHTCVWRNSNKKVS